MKIILQNHSEEGFSTIMGMLNGLVLGLVNVYCFTLARNPLAEVFALPTCPILFYNI